MLGAEDIAEHVADGVGVPEGAVTVRPGNTAGGRPPCRYPPHLKEPTPDSITAMRATAMKATGMTTSSHDGERIEKAENTGWSTQGDLRADSVAEGGTTGASPRAR